MEFLGNFVFCKICIISLNFQQGAKENVVLFCKCSLMPYVFLKLFFHKCDGPNLIFVNIHVENTFRALHCQRCGKYFKKKHRIMEHLKNEHIFFLSFMLKTLDTFYKIQNFLGA